ncbi:MAG: flagellar basal body L-ring protein FlgH [Simkaniaceae bacterium]|nr:flagellar basal body L-ring protein FlgH [Simkaniaceae bacterium]
MPVFLKRISVISFIMTTIFCQTFSGVAQSIYADIKANTVGDVVTVLIIESANASRESSVKNSSQANASADGSVSGNLSSFFPVFGASGSLSNSYNGDEGTKQKEQLTGKITATITEDMGNGMFRIKGERLVEVNGEENLMKLQGLVRSRDILYNNTVYSYNIADATIVYKKSGLANKMGKPGFIQRFSTKVITTGLLVWLAIEAKK